MEDFIVKRRTKSEMRATRRDLAKLRLVRIMNLRVTEAPVWVIKYEQIVLWFNRRGRAIDRSSADYGRLYDKYVMPHLVVADDEPA